MQYIVAEEHNLGVFLLVTVVLGGGAAWLAGRAIAHTWRPWWNVVPYMLILGAAVRFFHFSLFSGTLISPYYYAVDTALLIVCGLSGFRFTRTRQMVTQYGFRAGRSLAQPNAHAIGSNPE